MPSKKSTKQPQTTKNSPQPEVAQSPQLEQPAQAAYTQPPQGIAQAVPQQAYGQAPQQMPALAYPVQTQQYAYAQPMIYQNNIIGIRGWLVYFLVVLGASIFFAALSLILSISFGSEFGLLAGIGVALVSVAMIGVGITAFVTTIQKKSIGKIFLIISAVLTAIDQGLVMNLLWIIAMELLKEEYLSKGLIVMNSDSLLAMFIVVTWITVLAFMVIQILYFVLSKRVKFTLVN